MVLHIGESQWTNEPLGYAVNGHTTVAVLDFDSISRSIVGDNGARFVLTMERGWMWIAGISRHRAKALRAYTEGISLGCGIK